VSFWTDLILSPAVIVTALAIGTFGEVAKLAISPKAGDVGWRGVYYVTLPAHPVIVGALLGLIPLLLAAPSLVTEGYDGAARFATYLLAGIVCKVGYDVIVSTMRRALGQEQARKDDR